MDYFSATTAKDQVQSLMNFVIDSSNVYRDQFLEFANDAEKDARQTLTALSNLMRDGELNDVTFTGVNDSNFSSITDLRNEFDTKYHYLFDLLDKKVPFEFNKFINEYFPKPSNFDNIEKFLCDGITNGSIGLPPEVELQIWQRGKQRIENNAQKNIMESRKSMASRGFIEPNGAEEWRDLFVRNEASKEISDLNAQTTIKSAELRIDWIKFAVGEARNYRSLALESAFKYLSTVLSTQDSAFKYASGYVDSYKTFYDSVNAYYNSVNAINRLNLEKANMIDRRNYDYDKLFSDSTIQHKTDRTNTLTELARSMGTQAGAALSGINSIATLGYTGVSSTTAS